MKKNATKIHIFQGIGNVKRGSQNGGKMKPEPKKIVIQGLSIQEKVELHSAENAWKPGVKKGDTEIDEVAALVKKARAILNKLTPQKFEILVKKFGELDIDNKEKLEACIALIFEKALDEPGFSEAYANMCRDMQKREVGMTADGKKINFRTLLIERCQKEFFKNYMEDLDEEGHKKDMANAKTEDERKALQAAFDDKEMRARRRSMGNIRFIGELYKFRLLTGKIMHECVRRLLAMNDEESLECLCKLLRTVGKVLEEETAQHINKDVSYQFSQFFSFSSPRNL